MSTREAFEAAIKEDRFNQTLHFAYADWLSENGFDDAAEVQRSWTKEKQESEDWLKEYASFLNYNGNYGFKPGDDSYEERFEKEAITYEELLEICSSDLAGEYNEKSTLRFDTPNYCYRNQKELYFHYHRVKGIVPEKEGELQPFSCSC